MDSIEEYIESIQDQEITLEILAELVKFLIFNVKELLDIAEKNRYAIVMIAKYVGMEDKDIKDIFDHIDMHSLLSREVYNEGQKV